MRLLIPITVLISSSLLVACEDGVQVNGLDSTSAAANTENTIFIQTNFNTRNDPKAWFDEAEVLARAGQEEIVYLEQLGSLLIQYVEITKELGYPTGLNYEITNQLLGQNSAQLAVLDAEHPRVSVEGEIIDSWGTPYYFHSATSLDISIQSAGPDLLQYTEDDIVYEELNQLAEFVVSGTAEDTESRIIGSSTTTPSTFTTYQTGELLPR